MPSPHIQFRAKAAVETAIGQRVDPLPHDATEGERNQMYSRVAARDLERYYALLQQSLPVFSLHEAEFIAQQLNGQRIEPHVPGAWLLDVEAAIIGGQHEAFHIDGIALLERLKGLSKFELLAIGDAIERAWQGGYHIDDMREALVRVGLAKHLPEDELRGLEELLESNAKAHNMTTIEFAYSLYAGETATVLMEEHERNQIIGWLDQQTAVLKEEGSPLAGWIENLANQLQVAVQREQELERDEIHSYARLDDEE